MKSPAAPMKVVNTKNKKEPEAVKEGKPLIKKKKPLLMYGIGFILALAFLYLMPAEIHYMKGRIFYLGLTVASLLVVAPYCLFTILNQLFNSNTGYAAISILFIFNLICWPMVLDKKEIKHLEANGKWAQGKVVDSYYSGYNAKGNAGWRIKIEYKSKDRNYTSDWKNIGEQENYQVMERMKLIYSETYPDLYRLEAEWNRL